jgi:hypothetical protein
LTTHADFSNPEFPGDTTGPTQTGHLFMAPDQPGAMHRTPGTTAGLSAAVTDSPSGGANDDLDREEHDVAFADDEDVDPRIRTIITASIPSAGQAAKRRETVKRLIEDGFVFLDPDHLGFVRYVLNYEDFKAMLPRLARGTYRYPVPPIRLSDGTLVYYADAAVPSRFCVQQLANYRTHAARSLTAKVTVRNPVSRPYGVNFDGVEMAAMRHDYLGADRLEKALRHAHEQVKSERSAQNGWDPLLAAVQADGVTDGGLWMQTIFRAVDEDGAPTGVTHAALAPTDAASRKATTDHTLDPDGRFAGIPITQATRRQVFGPDTARPDDLATTAETVMEPINRLKKKLNDLHPRPCDLEDLDDQLRAELNTATIRIRIVIAIRTPDKKLGSMSGPELFIRAQDHFHTDAHLNHTEISSERLRADKVRAALLEAYSVGQLEPGASSARITWTPQLLAALSNECDYSVLPSIGLPATRVGAAIAAYRLVTGDGPERHVIGRALGSRRNGGAYDNVLPKKRTALLRELVYPDKVRMNGRVFENIEISAAFAKPQATFDGDLVGLLNRYFDGTATDWERGLFDTLCVVRALEMEIPVVDLGSQGSARGWLRTKVSNAVHGARVLVDKEDGVYVDVAVPAGRVYVRALFTGTLLTREPVALNIETGTLPHPTTTQWQEWSTGIGSLDDAGRPVLRTRPAVIVDQDDNPIFDKDGYPATTAVEVPTPTATSPFDDFSNARLKARGQKLYAQEQGASVATPSTQELFAKAADDIDDAWQKMQQAFDHVHDLVADGLALNAEQCSQLQDQLRAIRTSLRGDEGGLADLLDTILIVSERNADNAALALDEFDEDSMSGVGIQHAGETADVAVAGEQL